MIQQVKCPTCGRHSRFDETNPWRPFCSERCRIIDLGDWASGIHRIAGETVPADDIESQKDKS